MQSVMAFKTIYASKGNWIYIHTLYISYVILQCFSSKYLRCTNHTFISSEFDSNVIKSAIPLFLRLSSIQST